MSLSGIVNTDTSNPLIYDFGGFPKHFYTQTFESRGNEKMAMEVISALRIAGLEANGVRRGLDHGIWGELLCHVDERR